MIQGKKPKILLKRMGLNNMKAYKLFILVVLLIFIINGCNLGFSDTIQYKRYSKGGDILYVKCISCHHYNDDILEGKSFATIRSKYKTKERKKKLKDIFISKVYNEYSHDSVALNRNEIRDIVAYLDYIDNNH